MNHARIIYKSSLTICNNSLSVSTSRMDLEISSSSRMNSTQASRNFSRAGEFSEKTFETFFYNFLFD